MSNTGIKKACFSGNFTQTTDSIFYGRNKKCDALKESLKGAIIELVEKEGVNYFISGMNKGIDMMGAEIVLELKSKYPELELECALPYETLASDWSERLRDRYFGTIERSDKEVLLQTRYTDGCMDRLNKYLNDESDFAITVCGGKIEIKRNCELRKVITHDVKTSNF